MNKKTRKSFPLLDDVTDEALLGSFWGEILEMTFRKYHFWTRHL